MMAGIIGIILFLRHRHPNVMETLISFISSLVTDFMDHPIEPYLPFLGTLAIFLVIANTIGVIPFLVTPTRDINTPAALAITVFFAVHVFGIRAKGVWRYFRDLMTPVFMMPLEIIGQLSRTLSLTVRLFGNIISTEIIVAVIFALVPPVAPLPLMAFSLLTGVLQAYVFTVLAAVYIDSGLASSS
ncbi:MAG: F0F1 ATP synthase subunit A, partial [Chloroflexi bacterium]|nr:F0F1 ATP synthase subunit A [Chloroflexota bacterium]